MPPSSRDPAAVSATIHAVPARFHNWSTETALYLWAGTVLRHKAQLEFDLTSLVVPEAHAVAEAARLVRRLPELWATADLTERRRLLLTVLDAVYVDTRQVSAVAVIRPKAAFDALMTAWEWLEGPGASV